MKTHTRKCLDLNDRAGESSCICPNMTPPKGRHTLTPWKTLPLNPFIFDGNEEGIALVDQRDRTLKENQANAAFIVTAVNAHDELVEANKKLLETLAGAEKVLRKFLPVLEQHTDDEGMHAGEWLDEIKEVAQALTHAEKGE